MVNGAIKQQMQSTILAGAGGGAAGMTWDLPVCARGRVAINEGVKRKSETALPSVEG